MIPVAITLTRMRLELCERDAKGSGFIELFSMYALLVGQVGFVDE